MKKITKRLVSVMLAFAIVLAGIVIPSDAKAATKGMYYGYDTYEDYVEAMGLGAGGIKVSPSDISQSPSGVTEDGELIYGTYSEFVKKLGFVIPANCSKILVDIGGLPYMGYKSNGTKVRIYDKDGFDIYGYDSKYNNRNGQNIKKILGNSSKNASTNTGNSNSNLLVDFYAGFHDDVNPYHYSSDAKVMYVFNRFNKKEQFKIDSVEYIDANGDIIELSAKDYTVTVKTVAKSKDTVGIYDVTVKASKKYNNAKWSSRVIVIPQNNVKMGFVCLHNNPGYCYDHCKNTNETIMEAELYCNTVEKANQRETYRVEYKICKSTKTKTVKHNGEKYKVPVVNNKSDKVVKTGKVSLKNKDKKQIFKVGKKNKPGNWYYVKYRTYVVVDGEKIYSDWTIGNLYYSLGVITDEENVINDFNRYTYR